MLEKVNKVLFFSKIILLLISFTLTLYISFLMQDAFRNQIFTIIRVVFPMFLILTIFVFSLFFNEGNNDILFNVSCIIAFMAIIIIDLRSLLDKDMLMIVTYKVNFYYFQNQLIQLKILSYLVFFGNTLLIYKDKINKKEIETI